MAHTRTERNYKNDNESPGGGAARRALFASALYVSPFSRQLLFEKSRGNNFCSSVAQSRAAVIISDGGAALSNCRQLLHFSAR